MRKSDNHSAKVILRPCILSGVIIPHISYDVTVLQQEYTFKMAAFIIADRMTLLCHLMYEIISF